MHDTILSWYIVDEMSNVCGWHAFRINICVGSFLSFWAKAPVEGKGVGLGSLCGTFLDPICAQDKTLQAVYTHIRAGPR